MGRRGDGPTIILVLALLLAGCGSLPFQPAPAGPPFRIIAGSENEPLTPILQRFGQQQGVTIELVTRGSVDIMMDLRAPEVAFDAVWPASSLWLELAGQPERVRHAQSIMRSPVVFALKRPVAERLGWTARPVRTADILAAAEAGQLRFMMTSASQSNSGATAYLSFLYTFAGQPEVLTSEHLRDPKVAGQVKRILGAVDRSSGSSGWLGDLFRQRYDDVDGMVNYESVVIDANRELIKAGREPLYVVYPVEGFGVADSPLAYVHRGDAAKEALFQKLQSYLLSPPVQSELLGLGRRAGLIGLTPEKVDRQVFNPAWGIDLDRAITPVKVPKAAVLEEALRLYQRQLRKPSLTVYALDFSGSMEGEGERQLKEAMRLLLDQAEAGRYFLEATPDDITMIVTFNEASGRSWTIEGNDPARMRAVLAEITATRTGGGTNIYAPVVWGLERIKERGVAGRLPAVILMTYGESNRGSFRDVQNRWDRLGLRDVPVHAILFGSASRQQLEEIVTWRGGRIFDGRGPKLVDAFRAAKGYN